MIRKRTIIIKIFYIVVFSFVLYNILTIKLPYSIYGTGTINNLDSFLELDNYNQKEDHFFLVAVSSYDCELGMFLFYYFHPDYEIIKQKDVYLEGQTKEEYSKLSTFLFEQSINDAMAVSLDLNKIFYEKKKQKYLVTYIDADAVTDVSLWDEIIEINDIEIIDYEMISKIIKEANNDEHLKLLVKEEKSGKKVLKKIQVRNNKEKKEIGLMIIPSNEYVFPQKYKFKKRMNAGGSSGGLLTALEFFNLNGEEDIINGRKITGTGTIDLQGNVGKISSVEQKISTAVKEKADIFLIPKDNYKEGLAFVKRKKYNIKLYQVANIKDVIRMLKE